MSFSKHGIYVHPIGKSFNKKDSVKKIHSAKKATTEGKIKYMSGQLCNIIKNELKNQWTVFIKTPFTASKENGITVQKEQSGEGIKVSFSNLKTDYETLSKELSIYYKNDLSNGKKNYKSLLEIIYNYLNMGYDANVKTTKDFNKNIKLLTDKKLKILEIDNEFRKKLNCLSAILMTAEPFRSRDQGRQSRAIIRRLYQDINTKLSDSALTKGNAVLLSKIVIEGKKISKKVLKKRKISKKNIREYKTALENDDLYMSEDEYDIQPINMISSIDEKGSKSKSSSNSSSDDNLEDDSTSSMSNVYTHASSSESNYEDDTSSDELEKKEMKEVPSFRNAFDDEDDTSSDEFKEKEMKEEKEVRLSEYDLDDEEDDDERNPKSSSNSSSKDKTKMEIVLDDDNLEDENEFADDEDELKSDKENAMSEDSSDSSSSESKNGSVSDSPKKKPKIIKQKTIEMKKKAKDSGESDLDDIIPKSSSKKKKVTTRKRKKPFDINMDEDEFMLYDDNPNIYIDSEDGDVLDSGTITDYFVSLENSKKKKEATKPKSRKKYKKAIKKTKK